MINHCLSILAIPAVGADPQSTWGGDDQWLFKLHKDISNTILLQYDHLKDDEKHSFETAAGPHDVTKNASTNPWDSLKEFKVEDWSKRFLEALEKQTFVKSVSLTASPSLASPASRVFIAYIAGNSSISW